MYYTLKFALASSLLLAIGSIPLALYGNSAEDNMESHGQGYYGAHTWGGDGGYWGGNGGNWRGGWGGHAGGNWGGDTGNWSGHHGYYVTNGGSPSYSYAPRYHRGRTTGGPRYYSNYTGVYNSPYYSSYYGYPSSYTNYVYPSYPFDGSYYYNDYETYNYPSNSVGAGVYIYGN